MTTCPHGPTVAVAEYESTPIYQGWVVKAGYSGLHHTDDDYRYLCQDPTWVVELAGDKAHARKIEQYGPIITDALRTRGIRHARLWVVIQGDTINVREYDSKRFEFTITLKETS